MYVAELRFERAEPSSGSEREADEASHAINGLLGALRMNGQICGREWGIAIQAAAYVARVLVPEADALDQRHANKYVRRYSSALAVANMADPRGELVGEDLDSPGVCICRERRSYLLYTTYLSLEPPLRCGECFLPIALYRIPPIRDDEYYDLVVWQSDYQACDTLWMNSTTLERASHRQLSRPDSSLSMQGMALSEKIGESTGRPVYYYLRRYGGRSLALERKRRCPSCDGEWLLPEPWHRRFDFRCDRCRLVSAIAAEVRPANEPSR